MDGDAEDQENPLAGVNLMLLPRDKFLQIAYAVYKPSVYAQLLTNEKTRTLFAEAVEEESDGWQVPRLAELCSKAIAKYFKSGNLDPRLEAEDLNFIGDQLDIEMPLADIVDLVNDSFWKRVFAAKCNDMKLRCVKLHDVGTDFKREAIQVKLAEVIETTGYELWDEERMNSLSELVAPYVFSLHISKLTPMKEHMIERDTHLIDFKMYNYPERECHHGSLEMIGFLSNLTSLTIELLPPTLGCDYHRRYFYFSYDDIENLARGLKRLTTLKHISMKRSRLDDKKMKIIVRGLLHLPLESVDFSYCELFDMSGLCIAKLLQNSETIQSLELEGNYLTTDGLEPIAFALRDYRGILEYYGLARNPITDEGIYMLGSGLVGTKQVSHLNLNGIELTPMGAKYLVELLAIHPNVRRVQMCCIPLGEEGGNSLIEVLRTNKFLYELEYRGCEMTEEQEFKVRLLVARNKYFFDNPALMDEVTSKQMEDDANEWAARVKHPVLLKVNSYLKKKAKCLSKRLVASRFDDTNPFFIHQKALVQKSNSELLKAHFLECSGLDSETKLYVPSKDKVESAREELQKKFQYEPDRFDERDIIRHARIGATDRPHYNYFQPKALRTKKFA